MDDALRYLLQAGLALLLGLSIPLSQWVTPFRSLRRYHGGVIILIIYIAVIALLQSQDTARRCVQVVMIAWLCFVVMRVVRRLRSSHAPEFEEPSS